jgi:hypothetical protein
VKVGKLPTTVPGYLKLRASLDKSPFSAAALYIVALMNLERDYELGKKMLLLSRHESLVHKSSKGGVYKGYDFRRSYYYHLNRAKRFLNCFSGWAANSSAKNGKWVFDPANVQIAIKVQTRHVPNISTGRYKLFIRTKNRSTPFPVLFKRNMKGIWKVANDSSTWTGCARAPRTKPTQAEDDL